MEIGKIAYLYIILVSLLSIIIFPIISTSLLDHDVFFHLLVSKEMIKEKTPFLLHEPWTTTLETLSYPPLFHWVLVLFSLFGFLPMENLALFFQIIFYPLALLTFYQLTSYMEDRKTGFIAVIILSLYFPFFARTHLAIPEALQHIFIPLVFLSYLKGREKLCGLFSLFLFLNHNLDAFLILLIIGIHWLFYKRGKFAMLNTLLISSPGIILQLYSHFSFTDPIENIFSKLGNTSSIDLSLALLSSGILFLIGVWALLKYRKGINPLLILWFLGTLIILFSYRAARFPAYLGPPASIIIAMALLKEFKTEGRFSLAFPIVGLIAISIYTSAIFFPFCYDFYGPGINEVEESSYQWIKSNLTGRSIFFVGSHGYKLVYFTDQKVIRDGGGGEYLFSNLPHYSPDEGWRLIRDFGEYRTRRWGIYQVWEDYKLYVRVIE